MEVRLRRIASNVVDVTASKRYFRFDKISIHPIATFIELIFLLNRNLVDLVRANEYREKFKFEVTTFRYAKKYFKSPQV